LRSPKGHLRRGLSQSGKEVSSRREDVVSACLELAKDVVRPGESFAVRVQRTGVHGYRSMDIEAEAGARILEAIPAHCRP